MTRKSHPDTKRNDATGQGLHVLNHFNISGQIILLFNKRRRIQKASRPVPEGRYAPDGTEPSEKGGRKKIFRRRGKRKRCRLSLPPCPERGELNCGRTKTSGYALRTWPAQHRKSLRLPPARRQRGGEGRMWNFPEGNTDYRAWAASAGQAMGCPVDRSTGRWARQAWSESVSSCARRRTSLGLLAARSVASPMSLRTL